MSVIDQCDQLILAIGSKNNGKVSELVEKMDVSEINNTSTIGTSALGTACGLFNDEALNTMLSKNGIDVNVRNTHGHTPLHTAATFNNAHAVSKIVTSPGVDVNPQSAVLGWTPLHSACYENHSQIVTHLLDCPGIQVNVGDEDGCTPIVISAGKCNKEVLELMLDDPRVHIDVKDVDGRGLEEYVGICCSDEGKKVECLEIINNERMKRKNILVKQDGSMMGRRGGAQTVNTDDSQMDGVQKEGNSANPGSSAQLKVDYDNLCWNCSKTEVKLEKCDGCQKAEYCSRECWEEDSPVHGPWCRKKRCWGCEKTGVKLYKCGGCQKARYCKRECIEGDWTTHQHYCLQQQKERRVGME